MSVPRDLSAVDRFADLVKAKLRRNDHKGHWGHLTPSWLLGLLRDEVKELVGEVTAPTLEPERVVDEACDVAAFAMMIADVVGGLPVVAHRPSTPPPQRAPSDAPLADLERDNTRLRAELEALRARFAAEDKRWTLRIKALEACLDVIAALADRRITDPAPASAVAATDPVAEPRPPLASDGDSAATLAGAGAGVARYPREPEVGL